VLTRREIETLFLEHSLATGGEERHVFSGLYRVGLLGWVQYDAVRGEWTQRFLRPGETTFEADGIVPAATQYLLHPVLSGVIGRLNPAYLQNLHRVNIVGYARPWHETESPMSTTLVQTLCVLKGDVYGFGGLMHAGAHGPVRQALEDAVSRWARGAAFAQTGGGDSLLIAHEEPLALAQIARHVMDDVYQATGQPRLRMALHYGQVEVQPSVGDQPATVTGGDAILCVTRVEPHVAPGQIWATEEFREELAKRPSLWRTTEMRGPDGSNRINVKKDGRSEPDLWVRLYRLEF
jgi:class 3 adenylate cyclase